MATPALYWRISLRDQASTSTSARIQLKRLTVHDTTGTNVTSSATVTTNFTTGSGTLANLNDGDDATVFEAWWSGVNSYEFRYFQYQFASAVELSYFTIRSGTTVTANSRVFLYNCDFILQSSADGTTWVTQAVLGRPAAADDTTYQFAMTVDSLFYPLPNRITLGGTGGIYGIVSEDGVALPNRPVILYERDGFQKIGYTTTDINGGYAFNGLNTNRDYMVLSYDPSGPPYKNALVWDRITPINTLGAITPNSPFWARRLRDPKAGGFFGVSQILDGTTYNYYASLVGSGFTTHEQRWLDGATIDTVPNGNGLYAFLKSHRTPTFNGVSPFAYTGGGFFGLNTASNPANYANLTFEYIFVPPASGESDLCILFGTARDDTGDGPWTNSAWFARGPTLQVTTTAINFRMPLGGPNLGTVRATASVTQGQIYHVVVTYAQDTEIKMYVNGSLVQTTSITGAGRLWSYDSPNNSDVTNWNSNNVSQAARNLHTFYFHGSGATGIGGIYSPPAWGGRIGMAGFFGRTMSASDVAALYDSFVNPFTHTVFPTQSGYAGEVEADNPVYYERLNQLSMPANSASWPLLGRKDTYATYRSGTTFGATGFVSGSTATNFNNASAGILLSGGGGVCSTTFTVECFIRPLSLAATSVIFVARLYNSTSAYAMHLGTDGRITLFVSDQSLTQTSFAFSHTALVVGTDYHIAVTYEPWSDKQAKLYINGALVSTLTASSLPVVNIITWFSIGINAAGTAPSYSDYFRGVMGEFALYNYALSAARIQAHYDARNA